MKQKRTPQTRLLGVCLFAASLAMIAGCESRREGDSDLMETKQESKAQSAGQNPSLNQQNTRQNPGVAAPGMTAPGEAAPDIAAPSPGMENSPVPLMPGQPGVAATQPPQEEGAASGMVGSYSRGDEASSGQSQDLNQGQDQSQNH